MSVRVQGCHGGITQSQRDEMAALYKSGWTLAKLAERYHVTAPGIRYHLNEMKVSMRSRGAVSGLSDGDRAAIREDRIAGKSYRIIAKEHGCSYGTVFRICNSPEKGK